ncbi:hypothetical protein MNB_SV-3-676 [hydrothermal vent metagenome]|uniref:Uncharacterized protein n=1 Tax=hydrothermal vent metagenome TaxID=652676 RepID=A0A1W1C255_9ZZZZ
MSYSSWFQTHGEKHKAIMDKLTHLNDDEIIAYFRFENMVEKEPDFCPLYKKHKKCHDIKELNCYLCACPNFRFDEEGFKKVENKTLYSICNIDAKEGSQYISDDAIHQNCTGCSVPHHKLYIQRVFHRNWFHIMREVLPKN